MPERTRPGSRLIIMRHAKAEAYRSDDHERALTERGRRDAAEAGAWARESGLIPEQVLVSSAARALATWHEFASGAASEIEPIISDALYSAGPDSALQVLRTTPDQVGTLMFLGHNPTAGYLAQLLDDGEGDPVAFAELSSGFPTAAVAVLDVSSTWADLAESSARLQALHVGRG